jgi:hypothetical protein
MTRLVKLPDGKSYKAAEAETIEHWADLVANLCLLYSAHLDKMIEATKRIGRLAQAQYAQLESGEPAHIDLAQLDGILDDLPFQLADAFLGLTGTALFLCQDGPAVGAELLAEQIPFLHDAIWNPKGGDADADDGDS